jgi:hypothetical protein
MLERKMRDERVRRVCSREREDVQDEWRRNWVKKAKRPQEREMDERAERVGV